jgi:tRNA pseudouridine13 synthase
LSHSDRMLIASPLPQRFLTDDEGIGGRIKVRPADFLVEEIPAYEPSGAGEHLYLGVEKMSVAHGELMAAIRKHFGVREKAIGYAGMKDKQAVTRQVLSVHVLEDPPTLDITHDRIRILWAKRHVNKLRRGHLKGNRFSIRIAWTWSGTCWRASPPTACRATSARSASATAATTTFWGRCC